ncbi:hypothetical protein V1504DRAFT_364739, partial [Lipomyces starkeyi]
VNDVEDISVEVNSHVPGEEDAFGDDGMAVKRSVSRMEEIDEDAMVEEQVQRRQIVKYGQGVIRRREDRSPDTSDGEGQGMEVIKRTRRNPGREVVLRDDTAHEDAWRPVETGMVLRADGTVMDLNETEGDAPNEGHNQVSQPRRYWAIIVP